MIVVRHNGIGAKLDRENGIQKPQTLQNPRFSMFVALAGEAVFATEKRPSDTAADTVVIRGGFNIHEFTSCARHGMPSLGFILSLSYGSSFPYPISPSPT
jgi:hypothetical protein